MTEHERKIRAALTPAQQNQFDLVMSARANVEAAEEYLEHLLRTCKHALNPIPASKKTEEESTWCGICGEGFGWRCPKSPDETCHYFTDDQPLELVNGTTFDFLTANPDHDPQYETYDSCLFCGKPDERK